MDTGLIAISAATVIAPVWQIPFQASSAFPSSSLIYSPQRCAKPAINHGDTPCITTTIAASCHQLSPAFVAPVGKLILEISIGSPAQTRFRIAANDDVASGFTVDTVHEIRPTDGEIARACMKQEEHGIGLRFDKLGRITEWRAHDKSGDPILDKDGNERWFPAREGYRHSKGSRRKSLNDLAEKSAQHLSLRGSAIFQERYRRSAVPSYGEDFCRLRAAHWVRAFEPANDNRRDIDRLGIGAGVSFDDAWTNAGLYPA